MQQRVVKLPDKPCEILVNRAHPWPPTRQGLLNSIWMAGRLVTWTVGRAARGVPGLRRLPVLKVLAAAEIAMLARDHVLLLDGGERRRLFELVRIGRGRRRNLSEPERDELTELVAKMEPRLLAGHAVDKLSPVPIPRRLVYGPRRSR